MPPNRAHRHLPRLEREAYRGLTAVHWTFGLENRAQGWLDPTFHHRFREVLTHGCTRHHCACPIYCLMPDHLHVLLWGTRAQTDLYLAARFLRRYLAPALLPARFQKQAYDHVLTDTEMERQGFEAICFYIAENPVRAGLCRQACEYPFSGAVVAGYPDLNIHTDGYWDLFWRICQP